MVPSLRSWILYVSSVGLPILAILVYVTLGPVATARAGTCDCTYAGQCYTIGAQVADNCPSGESQTCQTGGWSRCAKTL